ncbi:DHHC palmitoyltransferase-domain-containing protein [Lineolata rhizophorae]|uniref:Palmitoyltransferase n=1 Tax=Lineolata rhizophorae TaxID=578093 RepID=A0A6A6PDK4_9PEZI|nr:DHHC palmitoyltransferase-domain-containing protein [Lineolata rhizophorae]
MATLGSPPSSPSSFSRRRRSWARRCERYCCNAITYFPLLFVYGLTTWAVWVEVSIGSLPVQGVWTGKTTSFIGIALYILLNWSYTIAVFTDPGSPVTRRSQYSALPTTEDPQPLAYTSFTVKSDGGLRFCKKCQTQKPDRAHHCSTCRRCVLKMDHHCPWLAACVGLRNYKPFLLFLIYTCLFCWVCFAVAASWTWAELISHGQYLEKLMPLNNILLAVLAGIIGLVLSGFTAWHLYLATKNQTTIESLEKTRYLSPLRRTMQVQLQHQQQQQQQRHYVDGNDAVPAGRPSIGDQLREIHANALPGVTRPEEGEDDRPDYSNPTGGFADADAYANGSPAVSALRRTWTDLERARAHDRWADYLDSRDSEALPNAFDLGWRRNLGHVFGPRAPLWFLPVCNSTGDGWVWDANPEWQRARGRIARHRAAEMRRQKERERAAGWGSDSPFPSPPLDWAGAEDGPRPLPRRLNAPQHAMWDARADAAADDDADDDDDGGDGRAAPGAYLTTSNGVAVVRGEARRSPGKADAILGRGPGAYADEAGAVQLRDLAPRPATAAAGAAPGRPGSGDDANSEAWEMSLFKGVMEGGSHARMGSWIKLFKIFVGALFGLFLDDESDGRRDDALYSFSPFSKEPNIYDVLSKKPQPNITADRRTCDRWIRKLLSTLAWLEKLEFMYDKNGRLKVFDFGSLARLDREGSIARVTKDYSGLATSIHTVLSRVDPFAEARSQDDKLLERSLEPAGWSEMLTVNPQI